MLLTSKTKRRSLTLLFLLSILITAAVTFNYSGELYGKENNETGFARTILVLSKMLNGYNVLSILLVPALFVVLYNTWKHKELHKTKVSVPLITISCIFGLLNTWGLCLYYWDRIPGISDVAGIFVILFVIAGWSTAFYIAAYWIRVFFDRRGKIPECKNRLLEMYDRHVFCISAAVIFLFWLPWIIFYYPASMDNDVFYQIDVVMNYIPRTNHHPWMTSFIVGLFYKFGLKIQNENLGIFLYIFIRDIAIVFIYASCSRLLQRMGGPRWTYVLSTVFYSLTPFFGAYAKHAFKDTFGAAIFCFLIIVIIDLLWRIKHNQDGVRHYLIVGITGLIASLSRNNYIYCILPTVVLLMICCLLNRKTRHIKCILPVVCVLLTFAANVFASRLLDVRHTEVREALSIPLQQIARVIVNHEEELDQQDRERLKVWLGNYESIQEVYNPIISDPVKDEFHIGKHDVIDFARTWVRIGLDYPRTYAEAAIAHSSGYFAFTPRRPYDAGNWNANLTIFDWIGANAVPYDGLYNIHYIKKTETARRILDEWAELWDSFPVLSLTDRIPLYTWGTVLICYWLIRKKRYINLIPVVCALLCILTCIASPVNDCFRYYAPVAVSFPALTALVFKIDNPKEMKKHPE